MNKFHFYVLLAFFFLVLSRLDFGVLFFLDYVGIVISLIMAVWCAWVERI